MFLSEIQPIRQFNLHAESYAHFMVTRLRRFPIEEFPAGAFAIVLATLSGMFGGQVGDFLLSFSSFDSPTFVGICVAFGIAGGIVSAIKLINWLNNGIRNDK